MLYHPFFLSDRSYHIYRFLNKYDSYHIILNEVLVELEYDILTSSNLVIMNSFYDFAYILFSCRHILHLDYKIPYEQLEFIPLLSIEKKQHQNFGFQIIEYLHVGPEKRLPSSSYYLINGIKICRESGAKSSSHVVNLIYRRESHINCYLYFFEALHTV